jgi:DNA (cytosine-5)-methyltransferase 1
MVSWPTPDSSARGPNALDLVSDNGRSVARRTSGQKRGINLETATKLWPTPTSTERSGVNPTTGSGIGLAKTAQLWPTPVADGDRTTNYKQGGTSLGFAVRSKEITEGSLNPFWVEWLMGVPIGWTSLEPLTKEYYDEWLERGRQGIWWADEPLIPRLAKKIKERVKRLKALGNGIVPATLTGFIYDK